MTASQLSERDWQIRLYVFTFWLEQERPPTLHDAAQQFQLSLEDARSAYRRLHEAQLLFLDPGQAGPGSDEILMAHP